ncbi:phage portal protein [Sphingobacterium sp. SGG-5]|uniref:phage portal protein n=1 Tax=Sphingobacterium sp. SGG-5 TaxID=2710881 RepID=UPI0013EE3C1E|nr:phage portal protein [Sphingobacterium sp. SGG-5]NGM63494.1 phage portal protein [Sphingobacterium sp. SGG-5]
MKNIKRKAAVSMFPDVINQEIAVRMANLFNANVFQWIGEGQPIVNPDNFDYIKKGYMTVDAVYECVDLIMKKVVASPPILYKVVNETKLKQYDNLKMSDDPYNRAKAAVLKAEALEEVTDSKIAKLFEEPNNRQTWDEFISMIVVFYLVSGNAFVYGNASDKRSKKWSEIWALPFAPTQMTIISGGMMEPIKKYSASYNEGKSELNFEAWEIEHIKTVNPLWEAGGGQLFGMSPLHTKAAKLKRNEIQDDSINKMLNSGGAYGIITPKNKEDEWSPDQREAFKGSLRDAKNSRDEVGRILAVSLPIDWLQIGLPLGDMMLEQIDKMDRESVYRGYHIPLVYASNDTSTFNNMKEGGRKLIYDAVAPVCDAIAKALTNFICKPYKEASRSEKYIIKLDYMSLPELSQDIKETAEALDKMDYLTDNEKREVLGWGKIDEPAYNVSYKNKNKASIHQIFEGSTITDRPNESK